MATTCEREREERRRGTDAARPRVPEQLVGDEGDAARPVYGRLSCHRQSDSHMHVRKRDRHGRPEPRGRYPRCRGYRRVVREAATSRWVAALPGRAVGPPGGRSGGRRSPRGPTELGGANGGGTRAAPP